jgi:hypothetical protein
MATDNTVRDTERARDRMKKMLVTRDGGRLRAM